MRLCPAQARAISRLGRDGALAYHVKEMQIQVAVWDGQPGCALAAGDLEPTEGEARRSHTLRVGRYAQHFVDALQMDSNPVEYLLNKYPKVSLHWSLCVQQGVNFMSMHGPWHAERS